MKMHPLTLAFEDPEVEASFDAAHRERGARRVRGIILVFCGALLLSIGFDVSAVPHLWHFSLIFKLGLAIPGLLIVAALSRKPFFVRHFNGAVLIGSVILGAAVLRLPAAEGWALAGFTWVLQSLVLYGAYQLEHAERRAWLANRKSERLLLNILPEPVAHRLRDRPGTIAEHFEEVTVLFADIVGFTTLASKVSPESLVSGLDEVFSAFDDLADQGEIEVKGKGTMRVWELTGRQARAA
ncbi:MAG: adenylate/guanylate cyclase domain-containing protein [Deltaproteobacteria bacterium]|nr:adenylate/guanylate cyclase domain-containing protein [Deltaproteobacteria bacterium]